MGILLANRVLHVKPSPTLAVAEKAARMRADGLDVINLGVGEPDFDTPLHIKEAGIVAIQSGYTKYTAVDGIAALKQAVQHKFKRDNALDYQLSQIIVSVGGKHCCYNLCQALLNEGDEVIIPAPYWVSYPDMVLLAAGKPVFIPATIDAQYKITPEQLAEAITRKTKLFFINSPSNPSGVAYTLDELKAFGQVLKKHPHVLIATDDMYEHIQWSHPFVNILNACPELYDRTIVLNGVSKAYAMTGWRIGFAAGPSSLISGMKTIQSQSTTNPCAIAQHAAVAALNGEHDTMLAMRDTFQARHDYVFERLSAMQGIQVIPSDGTFYTFPNIQSILTERGFQDDLAFAEQLLQATGLALVPGSAFGCPGSVRLSFAVSMATLKDALDRFEQFITESHVKRIL
jgi:aspartate aminotransferase